LWTLIQLKWAVDEDRSAAPQSVRDELVAAAGPGPQPASVEQAKDYRIALGRRASILPFPLRPGLAVGIALFTALVAWYGLGEISRALAVAGWGLLVVAGFHVVPLVADALAWRALLRPATRPPALQFIRARWIGESVNALLPVMQIGGNVAKARLLARQGVSGPLAGASVVVDVSLVMLSQALFALLGTGLLLGSVGGVRLVAPVLLGLGSMVLLLIGFLVAQRSGMFGAGARLLEKFGKTPAWESLGIEAEAMDREIVGLYRKRSRPLAATGWHLLSWLVGTGEVWLALYFLGHSIDFSSALILESLGQAVRAAAFAIPGALGVQEGGLILLGSVIGLGADTCLALSLSKRAREVLLGVPGLIAWQTDAARRSLARAEGGVEMLTGTGS
jgi:putative membrane protein